jgi:hypothetical protein
VTFRATARRARDGAGMPLAFDWPMALPPDGRYRGLVDGSTATLAIDGGAARLSGLDLKPGRIEIAIAPGSSPAVAIGG